MKLACQLRGCSPFRGRLVEFQANGIGTRFRRMAICNAPGRIQLSLKRPDAKTLVGLPHVLRKDAGTVMTHIDGVGDFVDDILEAAEFH